MDTNEIIARLSQKVLLLEDEIAARIAEHSTLETKMDEAKAIFNELLKLFDYDGHPGNLVHKVRHLLQCKNDLVRALNVITLTTSTKDFLLQNDPEALKQCARALDQAEK